MYLADDGPHYIAIMIQYAYNRNDSFFFFNVDTILHNTKVTNRQSCVLVS